MEKVPMTKEGYDMLQAELKRRQSEERPAIIAAIAEARAHGDLSENAEYHAAKEQQSHNEGRVNELEDLLSRAEIIDISKRKRVPALKRPRQGLLRAGTDREDEQYYYRI